MIIGSGLIATIFMPIYRDNHNVCIFASGVSNSKCIDPKEFKRERQLLMKSLRQYIDKNTFIYFSTCSISDPNTVNSMYVKHKLEMESLVSFHPGYLVFRLPQVVGYGGNIHNLLNFLFTSIKTEKKFQLWKNASRNILDVEDIPALTEPFIADYKKRKKIITIANPISYQVPQIVRAIEKFTGKTGNYEVIEAGENYNIDITNIISIIEKTNIEFNEKYLSKVIRKYFK